MEKNFCGVKIGKTLEADLLGPLVIPILIVDGPLLFADNSTFEFFFLSPCCSACNKHTDGGIKAYTVIFETDFIRVGI